MESSWIEIAPKLSALPSSTQPQKFNELPNGEHISCMNIDGTDGQHVKNSNKGEISPEQWDMAKPFIQRLYIEENRTFDYVAQTLREQYGFLPTKRQFDRKVRDQWGMWKNTNAVQKRAIVKHFDSNASESMGGTTLGLGSSMTASKFQKWRKELGRGDGPTVPFSPINQIGPEFMQWLQDTTVEIVNPTKTQAQGAVEESLSAVQVPAIHIDKPGTDLQNIWEAARIVDSPKLKGLFAAISMCVPENNEEEIPDLSLARDIHSESPLNEGYLCSEQIRDLQKRSAPLSDRKSSANATRVACSCRETLRKDQQVLKANDRERLEQMYHAAQGRTSPWHEIYPFPTHNPNSTAKLGGQSIIPLHIRHIAYEEKLGKLRRTFKNSHVGIVLTMETLMSIYTDQGNLIQAEQLLRDIAAIRHRFHRNDEEGMIWTYLKYINMTVARGRLKEAHGLHHQIHMIISTNFSSHHLLVTVSLCLKGRILMNLGNYVASEKLLREALQLRLNIYGPKKIVTLWALSQLAILLRLRGEHCSSEKLLRNVLQLHGEISQYEASNDAMIRHTASLGRVFGARHKFAEAEICFQRARDYSVSHLGEKSRRSLRYGSYLAKILSCRGDHVKAIEMFEALGPGLVETVGGRDLPTLTYIAALTKSLLEVGRLREAEVHGRNLFTWRSEAYGIERPRTLAAGWDLGCCLAKQDLYSELLELDRSILQRLRTIRPEDGSQSVDLNNWIENFQSRIVQVENSTLTDEMVEIRGIEFW